MHDLLADTVHAVLRRGLALKRRLEQGVAPQLDFEQAILKDLLLAESDATRVSEYGPDHERPLGKFDHTSDDRPGLSASGFAGVRYALVCWLDEIFTWDESDWSADWNEQKLEVELYGSNDRSWRFWQQAQLAQARSTDDALEAFYLCVMLGFRGDLRQRDPEIRQWAASARQRLGQVREIEWSFASQLNIPRPARPLRGRQALQRMVMVASLTLLAIVPTAAFLVLWRIGR